jgi:beta-glucosidase
MAQAPPADARARETERQMTNEERFALLISVMGANPVSPERDPRIPEGCRRAPAAPRACHA